MSNTVIKCDVKSSVLKNKKQCWRRKAERGTQKEEDRRTMKIRQQRTNEEEEADRRRMI